MDFEQVNLPTDESKLLLLNDLYKALDQEERDFILDQRLAGSKLHELAIVSEFERVFDTAYLYLLRRLIENKKLSRKDIIKIGGMLLALESDESKELASAIQNKVQQAFEEIKEIVMSGNVELLQTLVKSNELLYNKFHETKYFFS